MQADGPHYLQCFGMPSYIAFAVLRDTEGVICPLVRYLRSIQ